MAIDANVNVPSDVHQPVKPSVSNNSGIAATPAAGDGFFAQVSGNPFFTAVDRTLPIMPVLSS